MAHILFKNNVKNLGNIQGLYTRTQLTTETLFNRLKYDEVINHPQLKPITGTLLNKLRPWVQDNISDNKQIIVHSQLYNHSKQWRSINHYWHFDDPHFPQGYPRFNDKFTRYKQVLYIASEHPDGVSNTVFSTKDVKIQTLSEEPTWFEIYDKLNSTILPEDTYMCLDGELIEYDNKTLHKASQMKNPGLRLLIKLVIYDKFQHIQPMGI